jgi:hypothetical protein
VPDEPDQVPRLRQFREDHPEVRIWAGVGYWQASVPASNGETVITRYLLLELLDKLDCYPPLMARAEPPLAVIGAGYE